MTLILLFITAVLLLVSGLLVAVVMPTLTSGYFLLLGGIGLLLACVALFFKRDHEDTAVRGDEMR